MKRKYLKFKIPQITKNQKTLINFWVLTISLGILIAMFIEYLVPAIVFTVKNFISLFMIWALNEDIHIQFFGGIFFLIFSFKVISTLLYYWAKAMEYLLIKFQKNVGSLRLKK